MSKLLKSMLIGLTILATQPVQAHLATTAQVVGAGMAVYGILAASVPLLGLLLVRKPVEYYNVILGCRDPIYPLPYSLTEYKEHLEMFAARGEKTAIVGAGIFKMGSIVKGLGSLAKEKSTKKKPAEKEVTL